MPLVERLPSLRPLSCRAVISQTPRRCPVQAAPVERCPKSFTASAPESRRTGFRRVRARLPGQIATRLGTERAGAERAAHQRRLHPTPPWS